MHFPFLVSPLVVRPNAKETTGIPDVIRELLDRKTSKDSKHSSGSKCRTCIVEEKYDGWRVFVHW